MKTLEELQNEFIEKWTSDWIKIAGSVAFINALNELMQQYAAKIAIEFATQIDDTYDEGTSFKERLKRWGDIFDKWKSN